MINEKNTGLAVFIDGIRHYGALSVSYEKCGGAKVVFSNGKSRVFKPEFIVVKVVDDV